MSLLQGVGIEEFHTVYRGVLITGGWNREVPLCTEVSSLQGVGIEEFDTVYRGVLHIYTMFGGGTFCPTNPKQISSDLFLCTE